MNFAMKNTVLGRTEIGGSADDEESPMNTGGFPALCPLALFGHNGVTQGSLELVPSTDPVLVSGETLGHAVTFENLNLGCLQMHLWRKVRYSLVTEAVKSETFLTYCLLFELTPAK